MNLRQVGARERKREEWMRLSWWARRDSDHGHRFPTRKWVRVKSNSTDRWNNHYGRPRRNAIFRSINALYQPSNVSTNEAKREIWLSSLVRIRFNNFRYSRSIRKPLHINVKKKEKRKGRERKIERKREIHNIAWTKECYAWLNSLSESELLSYQTMTINTRYYINNHNNSADNFGKSKDNFYNKSTKFHNQHINIIP